jgi:hypothetical protein
MIAIVYFLMHQFNPNLVFKFTFSSDLLSQENFAIFQKLCHKIIVQALMQPNITIPSLTRDSVKEFENMKQFGFAEEAFSIRRLIEQVQKEEVVVGSLLMPLPPKFFQI